MPSTSGDVGPEHGVGLVEHQQRAVRAAHTSASSSTGATSPSIENTASVTTSAGPPRTRRAASEVVDVAVRIHLAPRARPRRQPSMIDAWFSSSLKHGDVGPAERASSTPEVGGVAGGEHERPLARPSSRRSRVLEVVVGRPGADDQARRRRRRCPTRSGTAARPPTTAGWADRPEVVVRRERRPLVGPSSRRLGPMASKRPVSAASARRRGWRRARADPASATIRRSRPPAHPRRPVGDRRQTSPALAARTPTSELCPMDSVDGAPPRLDASTRPRR